MLLIGVTNPMFSSPLTRNECLSQMKVQECQQNCTFWAITLPQKFATVLGKYHQECRNPNFGFVTKAKGVARVRA
jgi:hypothetical protein